MPNNPIQRDNNHLINSQLPPSVFVAPTSNYSHFDSSDEPDDLSQENSCSDNIETSSSTSIPSVLSDEIDIPVPLSKAPSTLSWFKGKTKKMGIKGSLHNIFNTGSNNQSQSLGNILESKPSFLYYHSESEGSLSGIELDVPVPLENDNSYPENSFFHPTSDSSNAIPTVNIDTPTATSTSNQSQATATQTSTSTSQSYQQVLVTSEHPDTVPMSVSVPIQSPRSLSSSSSVSSSSNRPSTSTLPTPSPSTPSKHVPSPQTSTSSSLRSRKLGRSPSISSTHRYGSEFFTDPSTSTHSTNQFSPFHPANHSNSISLSSNYFNGQVSRDQPLASTYSSSSLGSTKIRPPTGPRLSSDSISIVSDPHLQKLDILEAHSKDLRYTYIYLWRNILALFRAQDLALISLPWIELNTQPSILPPYPLLEIHHLSPILPNNDACFIGSDRFLFVASGDSIFRYDFSLFEHPVLMDSLRASITFDHLIVSLSKNLLGIHIAFTNANVVCINTALEIHFKYPILLQDHELTKNLHNPSRIHQPHNPPIPPKGHHQSPFPDHGSHQSSNSANTAKNLSKIIKSADNSSLTDPFRTIRTLNDQLVPSLNPSNSIRCYSFDYNLFPIVRDAHSVYRFNIPIQQNIPDCTSTLKNAHNHLQKQDNWTPVKVKPLVFDQIMSVPAHGSFCYVSPSPTDTNAGKSRLSKCTYGSAISSTFDKWPFCIYSDDLHNLLYYDLCRKSVFHLHKIPSSQSPITDLTMTEFNNILVVGTNFDNIEIFYLNSNWSTNTSIRYHTNVPNASQNFNTPNSNFHGSMRPKNRPSNQDQYFTHGHSPHHPKTSISYRSWIYSHIIRPIPFQNIVEDNGNTTTTTSSTRSCLDSEIRETRTFRKLEHQNSNYYIPNETLFHEALETTCGEMTSFFKNKFHFSLNFRKLVISFLAVLMSIIASIILVFRETAVGITFFIISILGFVFYSSTYLHEITYSVQESLLTVSFLNSLHNHFIYHQPTPFIDLLVNSPAFAKLHNVIYSSYLQPLFSVFQPFSILPLERRYSHAFYPPVSDSNAISGIHPSLSLEPEE